MTRAKKIIPFFYGLAGTLTAALAFAETEGHGGEEANTFLGDWLPRIINFAVLAAVLVYFARKPIRDFFTSRTAAIAKSMEDSREARELALNALADMERKVKEIGAETDRMIEDARMRGEHDKQVIMEESRKIVQDIQAQVKSTIDIEVQKAKDSLAVEAALLSIDLAEGRIKDRMSDEDRERILKDYINKVGGKR
jgi:F-type H+-transporting ATPase subunit b